MDFSQAALLVGAVFGVTALVDKTFPRLHGAALQGVALAVGEGVTFLVAKSSYAATVHVQGLSLDKVNTPALVLIGLLLGGGATVADRVISAIANVGQNQP